MKKRRNYIAFLIGAVLILAVTTRLIWLVQRYLWIGVLFIVIVLSAGASYRLFILLAPRAAAERWMKRFIQQGCLFRMACFEGNDDSEEEGPCLTLSPTLIRRNGLSEMIFSAALPPEIWTDPQKLTEFQTDIYFGHVSQFLYFIGRLKVIKSADNDLYELQFVPSSIRLSNRIKPFTP